MAIKILDLRNDFWIRFLVVPFVGLCLPYFLDIFPDGFSQSSFLIEYPSIYTFFVSVLLSEINRKIIIFTRTFIRSSKISIEKHLYRLVFLLLVNALALLIPLFVWYEFVLQVNGYYSMFWGNLINSLLVILIFLLLYESSFFLYKWGVQISKTKSLEIENTKIQLQLLKNQIAPHFLFNSLGTLMSLIEIENDKNKTLQFLDSFSNIYRYILDNTDSITSILKNELNFVDHYMEVCMTNYSENSIFLKTDVPIEVLDYSIPKLSLQMLVENALKHNKHTDENPLVIEIGVDSKNAHIYVKNNLQPKKVHHSTQSGLQNINDRFKLMGLEEIIIENNSQEFIVYLPFIKT